MFSIQAAWGQCVNILLKQAGKSSGDVSTVSFAACGYRIAGGKNTTLSPFIRTCFAHSFSQFNFVNLLLLSNVFSTLSTPPITMNKKKGLLK